MVLRLPPTGASRSACAHGLNPPPRTRHTRGSGAAPQKRLNLVSLLRKLAHHRPKIRLLLEADPRGVWQRDVAVVDGNRVGEAAEGLEDAGVRLVPAQP